MRGRFYLVWEIGELWGRQQHKAMRLIIETEGEFAPMFRAVAKAVNAKVKIVDDDPKLKEKSPKLEKEPFIEPGTAKAGEKPSDFFKGAWR